MHSAKQQQESKGARMVRRGSVSDGGTDGVADGQLEIVRGLLHRLAVQMQREGSSRRGGAADMRWLDLHVLQIVAEHAGTSMKALREHFQLPRSSLTSVINRLEERGLLVRRIHVEDRRSYLLEATDLGWEAQEEHNREDREMARGLLRPLSQQERKALVELLEKITRGW